MIPPEIAAALRDRADSVHLQLRSGVGTPTGESHLVLSEGTLRLFTRTSLLDPLAELPGVSRAWIEKTTLRTELVIEHGAGTATISLGYGEAEPVAGLLASLKTSPYPSPALDECRAALLTLLATRRRQLAAPADAAKRARWTPHVARGQRLFEAERYPEAIGALLRADDAHAPDDVVVPLLERACRAAGDDAELIRVLERKRRLARDRAERRAVDDELRELRDRRARKKAARRAKPPPERATRLAPPADAAPALPRATAPSMLPWVVLVALVLVGVGAAIRRLILAP